MTKPYSLETILSEFNEKTVAWVLQEKTTGLYVTIPHPKYPGKNPMHFFLSESDAKSVLVELLEENEKNRYRHDRGKSRYCGRYFGLVRPLKLFLQPVQ